MGKLLTGLIILDGYGIAPESDTNAISLATSPYVQGLMRECPTTSLIASGLAVGLPDGQMGNSEVGHVNIGAGRVVYQELTRVSKAIVDGDFYENEAFIAACDNAKKSGCKMHIFGLLSDGGVHSHISHICALVELCKRQGVENVFVHCFLDGRDVSPTSGKSFIVELEQFMSKISYGKIATISGRFYAMDRDNMWDRVDKTYRAIVDGEGNTAENAVEAIDSSYANGVKDEFVLPTVITRDSRAIGNVGKGDSIIFANFRPDRARMITRSFIKADFDGFERVAGFLAPTFVTMSQYDVTFNDDLTVAYKPETHINTFGKYIADKGLTQLRIAETQKYAHVTFFFNAGEEAANVGEERILIDSPKIATFDMQPEMSAYEVTDAAVKAIESGKFDVMVLNFANCDMVGHTGIMLAAQKAVRVTDECVQRVVKAILLAGGQTLITADHGNVDVMYDVEAGEPFTAHTTNPVPLILVDGAKATGLADGGKLCDIAPTLLDMMGLAIPSEMTGRSLIVK